MPRNEEQNQEMRAESRRKIIAAAQHLFAKRGFEGCNVSDIARAADMSQGNIYWYFSSKREILAAILADGFAALDAMMVEVAAGEGSAEDKLTQLIDGFMALARNEGGDEFITIVLTQIGRGGVGELAALGSDAVQIGATYTQHVSTIIAQAQAAGLLDSSVDVDLLTVFFFSFINGLMFMYPAEWRDMPEDEIRRAVLRLLGAAHK